MDENSQDNSKKFIKENVFKKRTLTGKTVLRILKTICLGVLFGISALLVMVLLCPTAVKYLSPQAQGEKTVQEAGTSDDGQAEGTLDTGSENSTGAGTSDSSTSVTPGENSEVAGSSAEIPGSDILETAVGSATGASSTGTQVAADSAGAGSSSANTAPGSSSSGTSDTSSNGSQKTDTSTLAELSDVWQEISDIGNKADDYVVDVCSIKNATDWFDNHFEKKDVYSGIIISADDSEVCVLTVSAAISSADSLKVSLNDGRLFPAVLKKSDGVTGLAVIAFDPEDEGMMSAEIIEETQGQESSDGAKGDSADVTASASDGTGTSGTFSASSGQSSASGASTAGTDLFPVTGTADKKAGGRTDSGKEYAPIEAISLDTSGSAKRGDLVIAAGSPRGISHSIAYAWLSYTTEPISITDGTTRLFYADRDIDCERGTWIIDLDCNLIGWLCDDIKEDDADSQVIRCIADYRDVLEAMVNGEERAYLGVSVVDMDTIHSGPDYPEGVYVKSVAFGGPSYNSGLQPGDYIADIGGHRITSLRSFKYAMNHIQAGSTVTVLIYRQSKETYKNIVFEVATGTRSSQ